MSRAPRVLVSAVVLGQPHGGVRRRAAELLPRVAARLEAAGGGLTLLEGARPVDFALPRSVRRVRTSAPYQPPARRFPAELRELDHVRRVAVRNGEPFDLLHTAHLPAATCELPYTFTVHDLRDLEPDAPTARRLVAATLLERALSAARSVIAVSETVRDAILARFEVDHVAVVPNAGDHVRAFGARERAADSPAWPAPLLHVGHIEPRKNLEVVVRALAADDALPDLWLVGAAKGTERERLEALAERLGVASRMRWLGPRSDDEVFALYRLAAAVVLPSRLEGFGIGALEAQLARAPLAVSRIDALVEVAGPDVPSFDPEDPGEAARAIHAALTTPDTLLEERAQRAERYRWDASADALVRVWTRAAFGAARAHD